MPLGGIQSYGIVVVGPASFRTDVQSFVSFVSLNTLRVPVFTPTNFQPPHQVDFQFPNVALLNLAQSRVHPVGSDLVFDHPPPTLSPPADSLLPNIPLAQPVAGVPFTIDVFDRPPPPYSPPADFLFPNVALLAFAQSRVFPTGEAVDETVPQPPPRPIDFQFENVAALAAAQRQVFPTGEQAEEAHPAPQVRQLDFVPPNLAVVQAPRTTDIFDRPPPPQQPQDFLFPNLLTATLSSVTYAPGDLSWGPWPQRAQPPQDLLPPNLVVRGVVVVTRPIIPTAFDRPQQVTAQLDFQSPNLAVFLRPAVNLISDRPPLSPRPFDIQFSNIPVLNAAQSRVQPVGEMAEEAVPQPPSRRIDFQFPNLTPNIPVVTAKPSVNQVFDRPPPPPPPFDIQFPNIALAPIPPDLTKIFRPPLISRPSPVVHPVDAQFENIALAPTVIPPDLTKIFRAPLISRPSPTWVAHPVDVLPPNLAINPPGVAPQQAVFRPPLISRPAPGVHPIDLQFPNLTGNAPAALGPASSIWGPIPQPSRQPDFVFPNLAIAPTYEPATANWQPLPPPAVKVDFQFANLVIRPPGVVAKPIVPPVTDRSAPQQRVQEFIPPNVPALAEAQRHVHPVGAALDETVPTPPPHQLDFQFANITLPASAPPTLPQGKVLDEITPRVDPRQLDFQFANVALLNFAQLQVKPPFTPIFERPIATSLPVDAPLPNLLTTTLAVVAKPIVPPLFGDRPVPQALPQDFVYNNLLLALQTPPGIPRRPNPYLFTDRPSPAATSWDQAPPNNTILLPPPVPPTGLHQNPMFTTMGRMSQLGNLP